MLACHYDTHSLSLQASRCRMVGVLLALFGSLVIQVCKPISVSQQWVQHLIGT